MRKIFALLLSLCLVLGSVACIAEGAAFTPGTYEGTGKGYSETDPVTVKVTVDETAITAVEIEGVGELPFGQPAFPTYIDELIGRADAEIDAVAGATMTRDGVAEAVEDALAQARGEGADASAEAVGTLRRIFADNAVCWQMAELGKVDQGGGGTVAAFMGNRNINTIDAGVPVLSMHAPFETVAKFDCYMTYKGIWAFYKDR